MAAESTSNLVRLLRKSRPKASARGHIAANSRPTGNRLQYFLFRGLNSRGRAWKVIAQPNHCDARPRLVNTRKIAKDRRIEFIQVEGCENRVDVPPRPSRSVAGTVNPQSHF